MLRRIVIVAFTVLFCLGVNAYAADTVVDGIINVRSEYGGNKTVLQNINRESNSNLSTAYLYWNTLPNDYTVYLGVIFETKDMPADLSGAADAVGIKTGIELTVNGDICGTVFPDRSSLKEDPTGYVSDGYETAMDTNRYVMPECVWRFVTGEAPSTHCEMRLGLKYWEGQPLDLGIRIFDYTGNSSNYHTVRIYETPTSATDAQAQEEEKTTKEKKTTTTTATSTTAPATTTAASTSRVQTTTEKQTKTEKSSATTRARVLLTGYGNAASMTSTAVSEETTERKTVKRTEKTVRTTAETETIGSTAEASATVSQTDLSERSETEIAAVTESPMQTSYPLPKRMTGVRSKGKLIGVAAASCLLTVAVLFSAFSIGRSIAVKEARKKEADDIKDHEE